MSSAVETESPQGIAATVAIPELNIGHSSGRSGLVLVLEGLQDPGNLGALLRSAEAFGASFVMMTPETVNPWNPEGSSVRPRARSFACAVVRAPLSGAFAVGLHGASACACLRLSRRAPVLRS